MLTIILIYLTGVLVDLGRKTDWIQLTLKEVLCAGAWPVSLGANVYQLFKDLSARKKQRSEKTES